MKRRVRLATKVFGFFLLALLIVELPGIGFSLDRPLGGAGRNRRSKRESGLVIDLFRKNCARCHGADGRGDTPLGHTYQAPDFTADDWWRKHSSITRTSSLVAIVSHGKGGMPAFGKKLKPSQIKSLVSYVRRFRKSV